MDAIFSAERKPAELPVCSGVRKFNYPTIKVRGGR